MNDYLHIVCKPFGRSIVSVNYTNRYCGICILSLLYETLDTVCDYDVIPEYLLGYLQTIELGALGLSRTLLQRSCGGGAQVVQSWEVCGTRGLRGD